VTSWTSTAALQVLSHDPTALNLAADQQAAWEAGQKVYAALTPSGKQADVAGSGHYIYVDAQDVVVKAIRDVMAAPK
jgi:hypothetical protein